MSRFEEIDFLNNKVLKTEIINDIKHQQSGRRPVVLRIPISTLPKKIVPKENPEVVAKKE